MKEFLGIGGYQREPEGFLSWQHILFVGSLLILMVLLSVFLGLRNRRREERVKNRVLVIAAILINAFEIFKIVIICIRSEDPLAWIYILPLFLCSLQLITIPIAAFAKGTIKDAALDFVLIFGILGAILGTVGAGNNYSSYPVLSLDNVVSGITHTISGFASLYIIFSGMQSMKKKNLPYVLGLLSVTCVLAYVANVLIDYNYMFLMRGDGTPYDILYDLVGGNAVIYPLLVVLLFFIYIAVFYLVYWKIAERKRKTK